MIKYWYKNKWKCALPQYKVNDKKLTFSSLSTIKHKLYFDSSYALIAQWAFLILISFDQFYELSVFILA